MIPFPDDKYLTKLGKATYSVNYLEWLIIEVVGLLGSEITIDALAGKEGGKIRRALTDSVSDDSEYHDEVHSLADRYSEFIIDRNHIMHARPATTPDNRQRLYRWAPLQTGGEAFFIDEIRMDKLASDAEELCRLFDGLRQRIRQETL